MKTDFEIAPGITLYIGDRPAHFPSDEERTKWTDALRSGRYKQGKSLLRENDFYCCLGVKEDLDGCQWRELGRGYHGSIVYCTETMNNATYTRPSKWLTRFGALPNGTYVKVNTHDSQCTYTCLTELNDYGLTFTQIADIIDIVWNPKTYANNP